MLTKLWWENPVEVHYAEALLVRAGVLPESERAYFRGKAWKWDKEAVFADKMEQLMFEAAVNPAEGWGMSAAEIALRVIPRATPTRAARPLRTPRRPGPDDAGGR